MSFFDTVLINSVCVVFPIFVYIVFLAYKNNSGSDKDEYFFELILFSTLFLIIKLVGNKHNMYSIILINIPLLFSYMKCRKVVSITLSIFLILYLHFYMNYGLLYLMFEYISYYLLDLIKKFFSKEEDYSIDSFTIVKAFYFSLWTYYSNSNTTILILINNIFISLIVFYLCSKLYYCLLKKGEEIINLNNSLKQLEKEKTLRDSLFKLTHEIKNPLAVCKGYLDMLNINDKKILNKYVNIVKSEVDRTLVIIDDFLDYTKIKVNKEVMDITYLLEDTINSFESLINKYNINLKTNLLNEEIFINGDYNRLKQVFVNVIKNSIESCNEKKKPKIEILSEINSDDIIISIVDNGKGMDSFELEKIGNMFYTTKPNGTGLGVSLSKEIIELHNGSIIYTSEKNIGTSVQIILPIIKFSNC